MKKTALIIAYSRIKDYLRIFKEKKIVLVGGCFDLIHYGHLQFLKKAKKQGDFLIVALESDEFIKKNKRKQPIHNQKERAEILANLNMVDLVIKLPLFSSSEEYFNMVKIIRPKVIAITEGDLQLENKKQQAKIVGGKVKIVTPLIKKFSTRKIVSNFNL